MSTKQPKSTMQRLEYMKSCLQSIYLHVRPCFSLIRQKNKLISSLSLNELNQFNKKFYHKHEMDKKNQGFSLGYVAYVLHSVCTFTLDQSRGLHNINSKYSYSRLTSPFSFYIHAKCFSFLINHPNCHLH
jgi:hypothetical protein